MIKGIEKLSLVDYDNHLSLVIFFSRCNFRCPFCHNSSLVDDRNKDGISFDSIINYLKKRVGILDSVVFTGGEVTLEPNLLEYIQTIKEMGYLIKVDTNGYNPKVLKQLIESKLVDYIAMDIKNSLDKYPLTAGIKNFNKDLIIESINLLMNSEIDYEFRTTVVEEYHDEQDIDSICQMIKGAKRYVLQSFINNENCFDNSLHSSSAEKMESLLRICQKYCFLETKIRR